MNKPVTFEDILNEVKDIAIDVTPIEAGNKKTHTGLLHYCNRGKEMDLLSGGLAGAELRKKSDRLHFLCPEHIEIDGQIVQCGCWCHRNRV